MATHLARSLTAGDITRPESPDGGSAVVAAAGHGPDAAALVQARTLQYQFGDTTIVRIDDAAVGRRPSLGNHMSDGGIMLSLLTAVTAAMFLFAGVCTTLGGWNQYEHPVHQLLISLGVGGAGVFPGWKLWKECLLRDAEQNALPQVPRTVSDAWLRVRSVTSKYSGDPNAPLEMASTGGVAWEVVEDISAHVAAGTLSTPAGEAAQASLFHAAAQLDTYDVLRQAGSVPEPNAAQQLLSTMDITDHIKLLATAP